MSPRGHVQTLLIATAAWAIFWVAGLPSYYQQYSQAAMLALSIVLLPVIAWISYVLLKGKPQRRRMTFAAWVAFYFTVPLILYDWLYCGVHLGYGASFFGVFWYLTLFYFVPWIILPATAAILNHRSAQIALK